ITTPTLPPAGATNPAPGAYSGSSGMPSAAPTVAPGAVNVAPAHTPPVSTAPAIDTTQIVQDIKNAGSDLNAYQAAYQLLQNKQYVEATAGFNTYLQTYPQGEYVANVDYWLGEIYLIQHNYPQAEQAFLKVVTQYSNHQKAADAMLKLGYVYEASGDRAKAIATLEQVQRQYPNTAVAHLAQTKASQLKQQI
ncbi:MAG TPA: tol-pal system protein YbgF, partial [Gammaproteobacteria bacterium]|nr:tol-pal system protein YbgF [Gammaproteobacteria bacterium]